MRSQRGRCFADAVRSGNGYIRHSLALPLPGRLPAVRQTLDYPLTEDAMHLMYFTEQPMSAYPADIGLATGHTALMFSNKYFDSNDGSRLYKEYLEH